MARACAICGKASMGGFNPQSSGMNRVRAHRRYQPNLQVTTLTGKGNRFRTSSNATVSARVAIWPPPARILPWEPAPGPGFVGS